MARPPAEPHRRSAAPGTRPAPRPPRTAQRRNVAAALLALGTWRIARAGPAGAAIRARAPEHLRYWEAFAQREGGVRYVALGDSTALGLGAGAADSYVGQLERRLPHRLQVLNLGLPGARLADLCATTLPRLAGLDLDGALVTLAAGSADLTDFDPDRFRRHLTRLLDALPAHALVADLPRLHLPPAVNHVRTANAILHAEADARDLAIIPLYAATRSAGPLGWVALSAPDLTHPNRWGYRLWAEAFLPPARARLEELARGTAS